MTSNRKYGNTERDPKNSQEKKGDVSDQQANPKMKIHALNLKKFRESLEGFLEHSLRLQGCRDQWNDFSKAEKTG